MLQITYIRENKDTVIAGLQKKRFAKAAESVEQLIVLDRKRRETQAQLDATLAQSNTLAKEIGALMKAGKKRGSRTEQSRNLPPEVYLQRTGRYVGKCGKRAE